MDENSLPATFLTAPEHWLTDGYELGRYGPGVLVEIRPVPTVNPGEEHFQLELLAAGVAEDGGSDRLLLDLGLYVVWIVERFDDYLELVDWPEAELVDDDLELNLNITGIGIAPYGQTTKIDPGYTIRGPGLAVLISHENEGTAEEVLKVTAANPDELSTEAIIALLADRLRNHVLRVISAAADDGITTDQLPTPHIGSVDEFYQRLSVR